jgi:hypothetical protein
VKKIITTRVYFVPRSELQGRGRRKKMKTAGKIKGLEFE